jgi:hypothetical protein
MNSTPSKTRLGRPALAIGVALTAATLMMVIAWFKRSAPAGSATEEVLEGLSLALMIAALFAPYLALPSSGAKNGARQA